MGARRTQIHPQVPWNWSPGLVNPNWRRFAGHGEVIIPVWYNSPLRPVELVRSFVPSATVGAPTTGQSPFGRTIRTSGGSELRYTLPNGGDGFFSRDLRWGAGAIVKVNAFADQQTIFAQSGQLGDSAQRRLVVRVETSGGVTVSRGDTAFISTSSGVVVTGSYYYYLLTCDGDGNVDLSVFNLNTGSFVAKDLTGVMASPDGTNDAELQLLSHFSSTNDDLDGDLALFWKLSDYILTNGDINRLARDPYGFIRMSRSTVSVFVPPLQGGKTVLKQITLTPHPGNKVVGQGPGEMTFITKDTDEERVSFTTKSADVGLNLPVGALETWIGEILFSYSGVEANDFTCQVLAPSGATGIWSLEGLITTATLKSGAMDRYVFTDFVAGNDGDIGCIDSLIVLPAKITFTVTTGATAGNVSLSWASVTTTTTPTTVKAGSLIQAWRVE